MAVSMLLFDFEEVDNLDTTVKFDMTVYLPVGNSGSIQANQGCKITNF
jgi:hypothetical protein